MLVAVCQLRILDVEDSIEEGEVVRDLLIAVNMKAILRFSDSSSEVRHVEDVDGV